MTGTGKKAGKPLSLYPLTLEEIADKLLTTPPERKAAESGHPKEKGEKPRSRRRGTKK
jgi:hypothetical protein